MSTCPRCNGLVTPGHEWNPDTCTEEPFMKCLACGWRHYAPVGSWQEKKIAGKGLGRQGSGKYSAKRQPKRRKVAQI